MRQLILGTMTAAVLVLGGLTVAFAGPVSHQHGTDGRPAPALNVQRADYYWDHHRYHHRDWDRDHHRWHYHD